MADNHDSELVDGGSLAVEVGLSDPSPELVQSPESPDGFVHVESSRDGIDGDLSGSDNQEVRSLRGDEDVGKEDMFVDCPDELIGNVDSREAILAKETGESSEAQVHFPVENRGQEDILDGTMRETESASDEYKEEKEALYREISSLKHQLKVLVNREELLGESQQESTGPLKDLVKECSLIVQNDLQTLLLSKNQEIEELSNKFSGFHDIETVINRLLAYYSGVVDPQELVDQSVSGKLVFVERGTYMLAERYNTMLYEIDQLRQCFSEATLDFGSLDFGGFFASARGEVLELKRKESEFAERISRFEDENRKMTQALDDQKAAIERLSAEVEQEKARCSNVKEKLAMAVTKGKGLVQERNGLKQLLAEKTAELERCQAELKEKSNALEAAGISVASLQETLLQSNSALEKFEEMMSECDIPEELLSTDALQRCRWLIHEYGELRGLSAEFNRVKDALSLIQLPETVSSNSLESQVDWIIQSLDQVKSDLNAVQDEFRASVSAELQKKDDLQTELDDLARKHSETVQRENRLSLERDLVAKMLLEASSIALDTEEISQNSSDIVMLVKKCLETINKQRGSHVDIDIFEKLQSYLYVKNQEFTLCELVLEDETIHLSEELGKLSRELAEVKEEKESLKKGLERSEEKSSLVREKLTMAVKKGKGLVQERESLKHQLDEKSSEIENLRLQLTQKESELSERIPNLEMSLASIKQQRDQLEGYLMESNDILQRLIGSIDAIVLPSDLSFEEPVGKLNWVAGYIRECQDAKESVEKELASVRDEFSSQSGKLIEAEATIRSLENEISLLDEGKTEIEIAKDNVEQELQKARDEISLQAGKFSEVSESRRSLEEALTHVESNLRAISDERESALAHRAIVESELEQVREEMATQNTKLTEAYKTIKSLEDVLSQVQTDLNLLSEKNNDTEVQRADLETKLKKLQNEADSNVKSLEDALLTAENNVSVLANQKKSAEEEIFTLNSKLNAYLEESAGASRSFENRSAELSSYLHDLQVLMNDNTLLSMLKTFEAKFDNLRNMDNVLEHIQHNFLGLGLEELQRHNDMEEDLRAAKSISECLGNIFTLENYNDDLSAEEADQISSIRKIVERFQSRNNAVAEKFDRFSSFVDEFIAALLRKLQATRGEVVVVFEYIESLKQKVNSSEGLKQDQTNTIALLEKDLTRLLSACTDATRELQFEVKNSLLKLSSLPEIEQTGIEEIEEISQHEVNDEGSQYGDVAEALLLACKKVKALCKQFGSTADVAVSTIIDLRTSLKEAKTTSEKAIEESDLKQNLVSKLEADLDALQNSCSELRSTIEGYQATEVKLKEREEEVEALKISHAELENLVQEQQVKEIKLKETEAEVQALQHTCSELKHMIEGYRGMEVKLKEKEVEIEALEESCNELRLIRENYQGMEAELKEKEVEIEALEESCNELRLMRENYQAVDAKLKEKEAKIEALQQSCTDLRHLVTEHQADKAKLKEKESEVESLQLSCVELRRMTEEYEAKEIRLKEREAEVSSLHNSILMREREPEDSLLTPTQAKTLFDKIREIDVPMAEFEVGDWDSQGSSHVKSLFYIIDNFGYLQNQISSLASEKEKLQTTLETQMLEIQELKKEMENHAVANQALEVLKKEQSQVIFSLDKIVDTLGGSSLVGDQGSSAVKGLLSVLEKKVMSLLLECESSKSKAQDLGSKLLGSQKIVDELSAKIKLLEDSLQAKASQPEILQARSIFEGPSLPNDPEISEIEDVGKSTIPPVPLAAQMRTMRKGSTDHLTLDIDPESSRLIGNEETDEDKGHVFKSLNTSGLVPRQGKTIADRVDGIWVSGGRVLMSRPRARIGVIAYCLLLHIWLLATIL